MSRMASSRDDSCDGGGIDKNPTENGPGDQEVSMSQDEASSSRMVMSSCDDLCDGGGIDETPSENGPGDQEVSMSQGEESSGSGFLHGFWDVFFRPTPVRLRGEWVDLPWHMSLNRPARYTGDEIGNNLISTVWAWQMRLESRGRNETEMNEIEIAQIASVTIEQAHVDEKIRCAVCWEDFSLEEMARQLVCGHFFHEECIVPWLKLRGTCPICRIPFKDKLGTDISCNSATAGPSFSSAGNSNGNSSSERTLSSSTSNPSWLSLLKIGISAVIRIFTNAFSRLGFSQSQRSSSSFFTPSPSYHAEIDAESIPGSDASLYSLHREHPAADAADNELDNSKQGSQTRDPSRNFEDDQN